MTQPAQKISDNAFCRACLSPLSGAMSCGSKNGYAFLRCASCDTVTIDPFPTREDLVKYYQAYAGTVDYRKKAPKKIKRATRRIERLIPIAPGKTFLDVGSNYGFTVKAARDLGLDATGIDIDDVAVKAARETFGDFYTTISIEDYAQSGKKADIIYTSEVIEHVPDPSTFAKAAYDILNPNGILYLTTPDGAHWNRPRNFADWAMAIPPEHITYFSRKGLKTLLEKTGFTVEKFFFQLKPGIRVIARKK